jgi:hypothetical protein
MQSLWLLVDILILWVVSLKASWSKTNNLILVCFYASPLKQKAVGYSFTSGAYAVSVRQNDDCFTWYSFAYENGYEEPRIIEGVGPFTFEKHAYEAVINDAATF